MNPADSLDSEAPNPLAETSPLMRNGSHASVAPASSAEEPTAGSDAEANRSSDGDQNGRQHQPAYSARRDDEGDAKETTQAAAAADNSPMPLPPMPPSSRPSLQSIARVSHRNSDVSMSGRKSPLQQLPLPPPGPPQQPRRPSSDKRGSGSRGQRSSFSKKSAVRCDNFYYHNEAMSPLGVGTVGLYANRAAPVHSISIKPRRGKQKRKQQQQQRRGSRRAFCSTTVNGTESETEATGTFLHFYTSACYTTPCPNAVPLSAVRAEDYRRWRRRRLLQSSFYRHSFPRGQKKTTAESAAEPPALQDNMVDFPQLYSLAERQEIETRRTRALSVERAAQQAAKKCERMEYGDALLRRRHRKLSGVAMDLPDSYYRFTYPTEDCAAKYDVPPDQLVTDHHRACVEKRVWLQTQRVELADQNLNASEKMKQEFKEAVQRKKEADAAYRASWMEGVPRISLRAAAAKRQLLAEQRREAAHLLRLEQLGTRDALRQCRQQEKAEAAARQQYLRQNVISPAPPSFWATWSAGEAKPYLAMDARPATHPQNTRPHPTELPPPAAPSMTETPPPSKTIAAPARAEKEAREAGGSGNGGCGGGPPGVAPSPPPLASRPQTSYFVGEVRQWAETLPASHRPFTNAADAGVRRAWLRELEEAKEQQNREAVQHQRVEHPQRLQVAKDRCFDAKWKQAEEEREEKKVFATRRAEQKQTMDISASVMRDAQRQQEKRCLEVRREQLQYRHSSAQDQRARSKNRDVLLKQYEEEELHQLRDFVVASHREAAAT